MMNFIYFEPRANIRQYVSSYYDAHVPMGFSDFMRAEIPNLRLIISGSVTWPMGGKTYTFNTGDMILTGATFAASPITFSDDFRVFGMAVTPLGWANMFDLSSADLADDIIALRGFVEPTVEPLLEIALNVDGAKRALAADDIISALIKPRDDLPLTHMDAITQWLTNPEPSELSDLLDNIELSHRQVDRICRQYFGASPKKLHSKFRALHSANRLTWKELTDWRDIALTSYYDQSHFIREFKRYNGRTPKEFIMGAHNLVRQSIKDRLAISHGSPFSLIG